MVLKLFDEYRLLGSKNASKDYPTSFQIISSFSFFPLLKREKKKRFWSGIILLVF